MTTNWDSEFPSLLPAIVCYADILGFTAQIQSAYQSDGAKEFLHKITNSLEAAYGIVREAAEPLGNGSPFFQMKVFTDNIVVAQPIHDLLLHVNHFCRFHSLSDC